MNTSVQQKPAWDPTSHYKDRDVARSYDAIRFASLPAKIYLAFERHFLLKALSSIPYGSIVADVPCGTGRLAEIMLAAGYRVVGMDISPEMLNVAQQRLASYGDKFTTKICDARKLSRGAERIDAVLCARVLMHFPLEGQIEFLDSVTRLTDGPVIFTQSFDSGYQRFRRGVKRLLGHQQPARYPLNSTEIAQLLKGSGLRQVARFHLFPAVSEAVIVVARQA